MVRDLPIGSEGTWIGLPDTSFLRNPHYHLPGDVPETLDYPRMAQATLGVVGAVFLLAGGLGGDS